ncbi:hypothetical protein Btru_074277 [Bulinus truncatus]|nr:hypothetical protein Btru_074277 [Bulinus truncatus]
MKICDNVQQVQAIVHLTDNVAMSPGSFCAKCSFHCPNYLLGQHMIKRLFLEILKKQKCIKGPLIITAIASKGKETLAKPISGLGINNATLTCPIFHMLNQSCGTRGTMTLDIANKEKNKSGLSCQRVPISTHLKEMHFFPPCP